MRTLQWTCVVIAVTLTLSLSGCNGGRGSASPAPAPTPSTPPAPTVQAPVGLTYSTLTATYGVGSAITANTPTSSGGAVASYSVVPTLPWGLILNSTSGVISGIPTVAAAQTNYTVTAYNAGGSTSVALSITVTNGKPTGLTYSDNTPVYTVNTPIMVDVPTSTGGEPTQYSVSPTLPTGLTFNTTNGMISGTPAAAAPAANYTVTASNAFGNAPTTLTITIDAEATPNLAYSPSTVVYTVGPGHYSSQGE